MQRWPMAWYFHIVELDDRRWACRHGQRQSDIHNDLPQAIEHATTLASVQRPAEIFVHRHGAPPERVKVLDADP
jgi:hypothetical protein